MTPPIRALQAVSLFTVVAFSQPVEAQATRISSLTGDIRHIAGFHSKILRNDRDVVVYLPPGYERETRRRYPVMYMADGQNIFDGMTSFIPNQEWRCDETAEAMIRAKAIPPMIIVGVYNAGIARADEYLPTRAQVHGTVAGGHADLYARMLLEELKPMIDAQFRTKAGARDTAVGGSSLGGILSLYLGFSHPEAISKLLVVSPSIWWDNHETISRIEALPRKLPLKIWMDVGTEEGDTALPDAIAAKDALVAKGWQDGKDLLFFVDKGAHHNEVAWANRFSMMLMFLYR